MAHEEQDYVDGWITYSTWIDNLRNKSDIIYRYDEDSEFKSKLLSSKTNFEKFKLLWEDDKIRDEIETAVKTDLQSCNIKRQSTNKKSFEESKRMRDIGNTSFKNGNFMDALNQYTQAVRYAPYPGHGVKDDSLALALANRSAALYSLTRYRLCLLDIDLAIKYGYPENNMFKLLIRKVKCLHILSVWANDVEQIKDNLRTLLKSRETKEFVKSEIQNMFEFIDQTQPETMEKDELDVVDETNMKVSNQSKSLSQAADCVEMSYDSDKGRYLITNKDVSFGRLLVAEEPFVCNLAPSERNRHCYNCFGRLHSCGLGCIKCTQILYCSEECLNLNADLHSYECDRFLEFQDKLGVAYIVAHIMFKIKFDLSAVAVHSRKTVESKSIDEVIQFPLSDWADLLYKNDYTSVLSLMDHSEDYGYDEIMGYGLTSVYLTKAFISLFSGSDKKLSDKETQLVLGSIILRHLMQLQTNLISILDQNLQDLASVGRSLTEMREKPIGVGVYPTISLLNHSCSPNILSIFHRNKFIARAATSLECGTEINYCYGPSVNRMSKKDRQKRLKEQYFFTCNCESCKNNKENEARALLCPNCEGPIIFNQDLTHGCQNCHADSVIDVRSQLDRLAELQQNFNWLNVSEANQTNKLRKLKDLESSLAGLVYWRHPLFLQIKSELIECAEHLEDMESAFNYCQEELELCSKTHGKDSYESIMTMLKLINIKWQRTYYAIEESPTAAAKEKAIEELKFLPTTIAETRGRLKDLLTSTNILKAESSYETELKFLSDLNGSINRYIKSLTPEEETKRT